MIQEKEELLKILQNAGDDLEKERERQANIARLRRDERLARDEDRFGSAALILGLAEKQDKEYVVLSGFHSRNSYRDYMITRIGYGLQIALND